MEERVRVGMGERVRVCEREGSERREKKIL